MRERSISRHFAFDQQDRNHLGANLPYIVSCRSKLYTMGKFFGIWSARTISKFMAMIEILILGIAMFAARGIPEKFEDDNKEWTIWRNVDFSISVVSVMFASFLLYGSIVEFRQFVFVWIPWNVALISFWITFIAWKYDELPVWERTFRIIAIVILAYAKVPVYAYYGSLRQQTKDPEAFSTWTFDHSDQAFQTLCNSNSSPTSSFSSVYAKSPSNDNFAFQSESNHAKPRSSVVSEASEVTEEMQELEKQAESLESADEVSETEVTQSEVPVTVHRPSIEKNKFPELDSEVLGSSTELSFDTAVPKISTTDDVDQRSLANQKRSKVQEALNGQSGTFNSMENTEKDSRASQDVSIGQVAETEADVLEKDTINEASPGSTANTQTLQALDSTRVKHFVSNQTQIDSNAQSSESRDE